MRFEKAHAYSRACPDIRIYHARGSLSPKLLAHLGEPTTPPPLAPRARAPPEREAVWLDTPGLAFDQSPPWDQTTLAPDPGSHFDQTAY